jgi:hypothetical protein
MPTDILRGGVRDVFRREIAVDGGSEKVVRS